MLVLWIIITLLLLFFSTDLVNMRVTSLITTTNSLVTPFTTLTVTSLITLCMLYKTLDVAALPNSPSLIGLNSGAASFSTLYFPFVYIFLLVTLLTLYFCFSYNRSELNVFSIYVAFILVSGLGLFSTTSLFMFFMFYEALLLPSFFILYHFAKTRKAVEAAYLMFF